MEETPICHGMEMQPVYRFAKKDKLYREYQCNFCRVRKKIEQEWLNRHKGGDEK